MKKYSLYGLIFFFISIHALFEFQKLGFSQKELLSETDYNSFVSFAENLALITGMTLLISLALIPVDSNKTAPPHMWLKGVLTILIPFTFLILIFNPIGVFPWKTDNALLNSRIRKPQIYKQLNSTPDIIFLGTSNSFHINAEEYAKKLSLTGFNFSVESANPIDYFTLTHSFLSQSSYSEKPRIIVIELYSPSLSLNLAESWQQYSIEYVRYMPYKYAQETIKSQFTRTFSLASFSTITFVEYFGWRKQWNPTPIFKPDGSLLPYSIGGTYKERIDNSSNGLDNILRCEELDSDGKDLILEMTALSKAQKASLIFYRTPINNDFYTNYTDLNRYIPCRNKLNRFMRDIMKENKNVYYIDLNNYPPVSAGGSTTFIDTHHLTDDGAEKLLKALTPTILEALDWK